GRQAGVLFAASYNTDASSVAFGSTHGVRRFCTMTTAEATVIAIHGEDSGYATDISRRGVDVLALGNQAIEKATLLANFREEIQSGPCDAILEPPAIAEVLEWMNMVTFSGQSFEDGSSFFVGNLGKPVVGKNVTLFDDAIDT